ncbi:hypothetical protein [uncultured Agrococcus sp.]|uniref:hypothetical protein n=1 Tax=uncultured Agrococcus sp. TaxID=382258 RepID=UPI00260041D4|nr:hypothetical protein [uncultured Agrococcus sp.]
MQDRIRTAIVLGSVALLALSGCAGNGNDSDSDASDTPTITAPPPTPIEPEPEQPEFPEFDDVDTSDWRLAEAQDGRGSLRVPPNWGWSWYYETGEGVPDGQYADTVTLNSNSRDMIALQDLVSPPEQCEGDGEAVLLDLAELPANSAYSLIAIAVPDGDTVQFAAGIVETERVDALSCGVSFFITDQDLPYRVSTAATLPDADLEDDWEFGSEDAAREYLETDEYLDVRASLLSFTPPS